MSGEITDHKMTGVYDTQINYWGNSWSPMVVLWNSTAPGNVNEIVFGGVRIPVTYNPANQNPYSFDWVTIAPHKFKGNFRVENAGPGQAGKFLMRGAVTIDSDGPVDLSGRQASTVIVTEQAGVIQLNPNPIVRAKTGEGGGATQISFQAGDEGRYLVEFDTPCPFSDCSSFDLTSQAKVRRVLLPNAEVRNYYYNVSKPPKRDEPVRGAMNVE